MKIVLATGIYPPDIGGPATYVQNLAQEFVARGVEVKVLTYARKKFQIPSFETLRRVMLRRSFAKQSDVSKHSGGAPQDDTKMVIRVNKSVPILRWVLYALALRKHAKDADIVEAFSSVSVGVPLAFAKLKKPKKILRLGGDFVWERYTAGGGMMGLKEWYESLHWTLWMNHRLIHWLLNRFDHIVFSTRFQEELYEEFYQSIPKHSVIENAIPGLPQHRLRTKLGSSFRLLFMGRFVGFKNLFTLLDAVKDMPHVTLTLVGEGPLKKNVLAKILRDGTHDRVNVFGSLYGKDKIAVFKEHDLLVIPSTTEISPNTALEAEALGLLVLLTAETGLSMELQQGMIVRRLRTKEDIQKGVLEVCQEYEKFAEEATKNISMRSWKDVGDEHMTLFKTLL